MSQLFSFFKKKKKFNILCFDLINRWKCGGLISCVQEWLPKKAWGLGTFTGFRVFFSFVHLCSKFEFFFHLSTSSFWCIFFSCYDCCLFRLECHESLTSRPVSTKCWMSVFLILMHLSQPAIYEPAVELDSSCGVWKLNARHSFELELLPNAPSGYHWRSCPINFSIWVFYAAERDVMSSNQTDFC